MSSTVGTGDRPSVQPTPSPSPFLTEFLLSALSTAGPTPPTIAAPLPASALTLGLPVGAPPTSTGDPSLFDNLLAAGAGQGMDGTEAAVPSGGADEAARMTVSCVLVIEAGQRGRQSWKAFGPVYVQGILSKLATAYPEANVRILPLLFTSLPPAVPAHLSLLQPLPFSSPSDLVPHLPSLLDATESAQVGGDEPAFLDALVRALELLDNAPLSASSASLPHKKHLVVLTTTDLETSELNMVPGPNGESVEQWGGTFPTFNQDDAYDEVGWRDLVGGNEAKGGLLAEKQISFGLVAMGACPRWSHFVKRLLGVPYQAALPVPTDGLGLLSPSHSSILLGLDTLPRPSLEANPGKGQAGASSGTVPAKRSLGNGPNVTGGSPRPNQSPALGAPVTKKARFDLPTSTPTTSAAQVPAPTDDLSQALAFLDQQSAAQAPAPQPAPVSAPPSQPVPAAPSLPPGIPQLYQTAETARLLAASCPPNTNVSQLFKLGPGEKVPLPTEPMAWQKMVRENAFSSMHNIRQQVLSGDLPRPVGEAQAKALKDTVDVRVNKFEEMKVLVQRLWREHFQAAQNMARGNAPAQPNQQAGPSQPGPQPPTNPAPRLLWQGVLRWRIPTHPAEGVSFLAAVVSPGAPNVAEAQSTMSKFPKTVTLSVRRDNVPGLLDYAYKQRLAVVNFGALTTEMVRGINAEVANLAGHPSAPPGAGNVGGFQLLLQTLQDSSSIGIVGVGGGYGAVFVPFMPRRLLIGILFDRVPILPRFGPDQALPNPAAATYLGLVNKFVQATMQQQHQQQQHPHQHQHQASPVLGAQPQQQQQPQQQSFNPSNLAWK